MFNREGNVTINIDSLTINCLNPEVMEEIMATFDELKEMITTIKNGTSAEVTAEIAEIRSKLEANTQLIAENSADDQLTKTAIAENKELTELLIKQLAEAKPVVE